jgi:hypothetical protein
LRDGWHLEIGLHCFGYRTTSWPEARAKETRQAASLRHFFG